MTDVKFVADLNPAYPAKGERRYCVFRVEDGKRLKLPRQFNKLNTAERHAYEVAVRYERRTNRIVYVGD